MRTSTILFVALACAPIAFPVTAVLAEAPTPAPAKEYFPQPSERESQLDAALDQHVSIDFQEMPLAEVANWFSSKLEVPVVLDSRSLDDAGIGSDTPVTRKVDGISARAVLKLVLVDVDLAYLQADGVMTITTTDSAETQLVTRVYPVGDLTPLVAASGGIGGMSGPVLNVADDESKPASTESTKEKRESQPKKGASATVKATPDYDSLIEVITSTVRPQSWDEVGGPGSVSEMVAAKSIVVSQTREVHHEILELLRALRAAKQVGESVEAK